MIDSTAFKIGMRRLASGIALVTTEYRDTSYGIAATSVTALTADPPTLLVCINRSASCHDAIGGAGHFCVNILAPAHEDLLRAFSTSSRRHERFSSARWIKRAPHPPHLTDASAVFDCLVSRTFQHGTHTIFIGEVSHVACHGSEQDALIYINGCAHPFPIMSSCPSWSM